MSRTKLPKIRQVSKSYCIVASCPAVYETDRGTYIVVGGRLPTNQAKRLLSGKIGKEEVAVEISKDLLKDLRG